MVNERSLSNYSASLADYVMALRFERLPPNVVEAAKTRILDGLSVMIYGSGTPVADLAERYVRLVRQGTAGGVSGTLEAFPRRDLCLDPQEVGFMLGTFGFSLNYADTSLLSVSHPGSIVIPSLILGSQGKSVDGRTALTATVAGYEVMEHIARGLNNGTPRMGHQLKGFRPTATCGVFGTVAALGILWELNERVLSTAFELACNYACGLRRHEGSDVAAIRIQSGEAVRHGVTAILLAMSGLEGDAQMFDGDGGFFEAYMAETIDESSLRQVDTFTIEELAVKLHCTAHTLPSALDAILDIRKEQGLGLADVAAVEIALPEPHAAVARIRKAVPVDLMQAGGSYEYCAGMVLLDGDYLWPDRMSALLGSKEIGEFARNVAVYSDPDLTTMFEADRGIWPARVKLTTRSGCIFEHERLNPVGLGMSPHVKDLVERKFRVLTDRFLSSEASVQVASLVSTMEVCHDFYSDLVHASGLPHPSADPTRVAVT